MKVLQYITGGLLMACVALGARSCSLDNSRDLAVSKQAAAESARDAAITERDAWKSKASDALAANRVYDLAFAQVQAAAEEQQRMATAAAAKAQQVVAAARADEAKAERQLADFRRRFAAKPANCAAALKALDAACASIGERY